MGTPGHPRVTAGAGGTPKTLLGGGGLPALPPPRAEGVPGVGPGPALTQKSALKKKSTYFTSGLTKEKSPPWGPPPAARPAMAEPSRTGPTPTEPARTQPSPPERSRARPVTEAAHTASHPRRQRSPLPSPLAARSLARLAHPAFPLAARPVAQPPPCSAPPRARCIGAAPVGSAPGFKGPAPLRLKGPAHPRFPSRDEPGRARIPPG